ncbi:IQ domain-containing protein C [Anolis carolinensis]|uniref:IQ domain-containing protein C n=1 Tax=Anolis carolinensis TaxID=28377 RepID=UPI000203AE40|nr:PREDICTED: IQ domain-containing protein C [Anolis carolinensis]|eukprot:XP_003228759.1 PREDICTED: IQ domain-containing protein C [Anolis carolinensis]
MGQEGAQEPPWGSLFLKRVVVLQAYVRGYLVRKRFQGLKQEYEDIVKEIEGNLDRLQWENHSVPKPIFLPKKSIKMKGLSSQDAESSKKQEHEPKLCCQEELLPEKDCKMQFPRHLSEEVIDVKEENDVRQNPEYFESKPPGNACIVSAEDEEDKEQSNASSTWSSLILGAETPPQGQTLLCHQRQAMPELQEHRKHLAMELLWLQQAIVSRKNYLILKQKMGSAE